MINFARGFGDYVAAIAGGVGVALIAALIVLALSRVTLPTLRRLWRRASPFGRLFGALLFLICSINATTKADVTYAAVDDLCAANNLLRSASGWRGTTWNTAGGGLEWTLPTETILVIAQNVLPIMIPT